MISKKFSQSLRIFLGLAVVSMGGGCAAYVMNPATQPGRAPVITHTYSVERGRFGDVLKIYVQAEDPDNDMLRIAAVVEQPGIGRYPTDWTYLKPQYAGHFSGYLKWNTSSANTGYLSEWTWITIKVSVFDKTGRESNVVVFPYEFVSEGIHPPPPPAPFDQANVPMLGNIMINLYDPGRTGRGTLWWKD